jgi:hypothetical protein
MAVKTSLFLFSLLSFISLSSLLNAEDAKVPFMRGVKVEVMVGRPTKTKGGDFDDKTQTLKPRVKLTNTTPTQPYADYKAVYLLLGQSLVDTKVSKVLLRHEFPVSIPVRQALDEVISEVTTMYDVDHAKFGFKYDGWVLQISDPKGEVVLTKSTSPSMEKMPKEVATMKADQCYNKKLQPVSEPRLLR